MKRFTSLPSRKSRGFTLIEIMVVVAILGVLVGLVGPKVFNQRKKANIDATKGQIRAIENALDMYRLQYNVYPSTEEGLEALVSPPDGGDSMMGKVPKDAWGKEFSYVGEGDSFEIASGGPDVQLGTGDDISNLDE